MPRKLQIWFRAALSHQLELRQPTAVTAQAGFQFDDKMLLYGRAHPGLGATIPGVRQTFGRHRRVVKYRSQVTHT